jgi:pimeloyl-ACP methyl ester carboxylesterase
MTKPEPLGRRYDIHAIADRNHRMRLAADARRRIVNYPSMGVIGRAVVWTPNRRREAAHCFGGSMWYHACNLTVKFSSEVPMPHVSTDSESFVVTLVHGTWAKQAEWAMPGSAFCSALEQRLGRPVRFLSFNWSGRNSQSQRTLAGEALARHIAEQVERNPKALHFLICHSHGGNVALYALRDHQRKIAGLVCLSTPFLAVHPRAIGKTWILGINLMIPLVMAMLLILYIVWTAKNGSSIEGVMMACGTAFGVVIVLSWLNIGQRWVAAAAKSAQRYTIPGLSRNQLLIVRIGGDEASAGLGAAQFIGWLGQRLWLRVNALLERMSKGDDIDRALEPRELRALMSPVVAIAGPMVVLLIVLLLGAPQWVVSWTSVLCIFFVVPALIVVSWGALTGFAAAITALLAFLSSCLIGLPLIAFSPDLAIMGLLLEFSVETTPPGTWTVLHLDATAEDSQNMFVLRHSLSYLSSRAVIAIASWMTTTAGSSA